MRALLTALTAWVKEGKEPPASVVPRIADGTLVAPLHARMRTQRAYWLILAESARGRPEARRLVEWIASTARAQTERQ